MKRRIKRTLAVLLAMTLMVSLMKNDRLFVAAETLAETESVAEEVVQAAAPVAEMVDSQDEYAEEAEGEVPEVSAEAPGMEEVVQTPENTEPSMPGQSAPPEVSEDNSSTDTTQENVQPTITEGTEEISTQEDPGETGTEEATAEETGTEEAGMVSGNDVSGNDISGNDVPEAVAVKKSAVMALAATQSYNLYMYTLLPGLTLDDTAGAKPDDVWNGMGIGAISNVRRPNNYSTGTIIDDGYGSNGVDIDYKANQYPDITVNGKAYKYASSPELEDIEGYYTVSWIRVVVSDGANAGNNGYIKPTVGSGTNTFHLDGVITLNEADKYTVHFAIKDAGGNSFQIVEPQKYSKRVDSGYAANKLTRPDVNDPATYPSEKTVNGVTYVFDGWYTNEACTDRVDWNTETITENTVFYGQYKPKTVNLQISKTVSGLTDADRSKIEDGTFTFEIKNGSDVVRTVRLPQNGSWSTTAALESGTYTVTETNASGVSIDGYNYEKTGVVVDGGSSAESSFADVSLTRDGTVAFTNYYTEALCNLIVTKTLEGLNSLDAAQLDALKNALTFTVKDSEGNNVGGGSFSLSEMTESGGTFSKTLTGLEAGTYTVTETGTEVTYYDCAVTKTGFDTEEGQQTDAVTLTAGIDKTVSFTNSYTRRTHTVTIRKVVAGNMGDPSGTFAFDCWYGNDNNNKTHVSITAANGIGTYEIGNVEEGTVLHIQEDDVSADGYEVTVAATGSENTVFNDSTGLYTGTVLEDTTVTFTNTKNVVSPPTGVSKGMIPYVVMVLMGLTAAVWFALMRRRKV